VIRTSGKNSSFWSRIGDQFGLNIIREYLIPVETNNFWYSLGGILGISIALQFLFGFILLYKYIPDAGLAFGITQSFINSPSWKIVLNFHFWNSFLIVGLIAAHMMRVFISGAYRSAKRGLWLIGTALSGLVFSLYLTGEALHWDEVGFGVPWNTSEILSAVNLAGFFRYNTSDLLSIPTATTKLSQFYAVHVALAPTLLVILVGLHLYLVKSKGISTPFWKKVSGKKAPFKEHIKIWLIGGIVILVALLLIAAFVPRSAGTAPQLLPNSPFYGTDEDPGGLGFKPTFAIGWTRGMNILVGQYLGIEPDIWGAMMAMVLMAGALLIIPFVDRGEEPRDASEVFAWRKRIWAFLAIAVFWAIFIVGVILNTITAAG
jgi:quinol-cytochrome oxidoreductase complex cytochrome b subunit